MERSEINFVPIQSKLEKTHSSCMSKCLATRRTRFLHRRTRHWSSWDWERSFPNWKSSFI